MSYSDRDDDTVFGYPGRPQKTLPEALDAAQTGEEFGQVLRGLFVALEQARDQEQGR